MVAAGISAYISLTMVIKGEDTVIVPALTGENIVYALEILTDLGLNTKVKGSEYSDAVPKSHIIFQDPKPGAEIKKDRDVRIVISKGAQTVVMPKLTGLPLRQAKIILEENDLYVNVESRTHNQMFQKDEIIAQRPDSGAEINRNTAVGLLVSLGHEPDAFLMPDMAGTSPEDALLMLEKYKISFGKIEFVYYKHKQKNTIISHSPSAGGRVIEGSMVDVVVNRKAGRNDTSFLRGQTGIRLFRYRLENGFLKKHIRINVNCFGLQSDFFNEIVKPGHEIWVLIPRFTNATVLLYKDEELIKTEIYN